jgi:membrane protease YdiL (CAAX protease family)
VWLRTGLVIGLMVGACAVAGWEAWMLSGPELPAYAAKAPPPVALGERFLQMCVFAPVLEEAVYRLACCVPLAALVGPWPAVLVRGAAFGLLHVICGNPSPT